MGKRSLTFTQPAQENLVEFEARIEAVRLGNTDLAKAALLAKMRQEPKPASWSECLKALRDMS